MRQFHGPEFNAGQGGRASAPSTGTIGLVHSGFAATGSRNIDGDEWRSIRFPRCRQKDIRTP